MSGPEAERVKKKLQRIFKDRELDITIECNKKIVDYLDVTFNLNDGSYKPYQKPDSVIQYINVQSNHPANIIKQILKTIEKRISDHSSSERIFKEAVPFYEKALKESGYDSKLYFNPTANKPNQGKNRKRNIIWFNPPFSKSVITKVGQGFLNLLDKHFPKNHKLNKIFNRNTVKVSYSCTKNMKGYITSHNSKILNDRKEEENGRKCNCLNKQLCPVNGECLTGNVIYEARVVSDDPAYTEKVYIGLSEPAFKKRYANHKKSFRYAKYEKDTELSKEIWKIGRENHVPKIKWNILKRCAPFNKTALKCSLCLHEKLEIALFEGDNLLNKRSELISKCRHINKHMLMRHDTKD